jgi:hypothetical protein
VPHLHDGFIVDKVGQSREGAIRLSLSEPGYPDWSGHPESLFRKLGLVQPKINFEKAKI